MPKRLSGYENEQKIKKENRKKRKEAKQQRRFANQTFSHVEYIKTPQIRAAQKPNQFVKWIK